jgi:hypothetical protein
VTGGPGRSAMPRAKARVEFRREEQAHFLARALALLAGPGRMQAAGRLALARVGYRPRELSAGR